MPYNCRLLSNGSQAMAWLAGTASGNPRLFGEGASEWMSEERNFARAVGFKRHSPFSLGCAPPFLMRHCSVPAALFLLLAVPPLPASQDRPAPDASPAATPAPVLSTVAGKPGFVTLRTVLWAGRTAVIPLRVTQAAAADQTYALNTSELGVLEIVRPPTVLAGETQGYLRVRALRPGHVRLGLLGDATLDVEVRPDPVGAAFAQVDAESPRPRIVSPVPDAVVWGTLAVGVDVFDASASPAAEPKVQLCLPNGQTLDPVAHTGPEAGPARHYQFQVAADDLPVGPAKLVAVSSPAGFTDVDRLARKPGALLESKPLVVRVQRPSKDALLSGDCADPAIIGTTKELYAPAHPSRFGTRAPVVGNDPAASGGKVVQCFSSDPAWSLPFNAREPGEYQMFIRARGDLGGAAFPTVGIYLDNAESPLTTGRLSSDKYHRVPVGGPVFLKDGWQMLTVRFINDFSVGKEDRNFFLDEYEIARVGDAPTAASAAAAPATVGAPASANLAAAVATAAAKVDATAPAAAQPAPAYRPGILYPANGASVFGVDAVVARVANGGGNGPAAPAWMDVIVDGQPQGVRTAKSAGADAFLCPLLVRQILPGAHRLAVRVADAAGRTTDSPAQLLNVLPAAPAARGPYERAVFLLDRLAFGPDPRELAAALTLGETVWLNNRLNAPFDSPGEQALLRVACTKYPRIDDENQGVARALTQWIGTDNPVRARFTAWAENRFSTWINKTKAAPKWHEHLDFCRLGVAPFADLLAVSAHSPAMLVYLDQEKSYAGKLNENYAREIMELHTLGVHGGYAQTDVTALANVLNGWTLASEAALPQTDAPLALTYSPNNEFGQSLGFRFVPALNDGKARRVFGLEFPAAEPSARYDRVRLALEMLSSHPGTAEHIARKLTEHYVAVPAPDALVQRLSQTFLESGGDLRAVMRTLASSNAFWNSAPRMATPFDYGVRIARLCRASATETGAALADSVPKPDQIGNFLKKSGMGLFDRVTPDGYPENSAAYIDSNALLQRWHFMEANIDPLNRLVPKDWRTPPAPVLTPAANEGGAGLPTGHDDSAQRFVDLVALRLTGRLLTPTSNAAAREILADGTPDQMKQTILFVALLPETNLR